MIDTVNCSAEENAERILAHLIELGFVLLPSGPAARPPGKSTHADLSEPFAAIIKRDEE